MRRETAFTLIELLVVIGVFLAVAAVVGGILFSTLRGSQKSTTIDTVRENGNFALSTMTKTIRGAKSVTWARSGGGCPSPGIRASGEYLDILSQDNQTISFQCGTVLSPDDIGYFTSSWASLINTAAVKIGSCSFTCTKAEGEPPVVKIKFTLTQAGTSTFAEQTSAVDFDTSVTLRNP